MISHERHLLDRRITVCLHWAFLRHVMNGSPTPDAHAAILQEQGLLPEAESFFDRLVPLLGDKVAVVRSFFDWFRGSAPTVHL